MYCGYQSRPAVGKILPLHLIQTTFFPLEKSGLANLLKFVHSLSPGIPGLFEVGLVGGISADRLGTHTEMQPGESSQPDRGSPKPHENWRSYSAIQEQASGRQPLSSKSTASSVRLKESKKHKTDVRREDHTSHRFLATVVPVPNLSNSGTRLPVHKFASGPALVTDCT